MSNIEKLKQELLAQKTAIENIGGNVIVTSNNPSPGEITAGIKTIQPAITSTALLSANATEDDVIVGKTFFAGNNLLKTGSFINNTQELEAFIKGYLDASYESDTFVTPSIVKTIKPYAFAGSQQTGNCIINKAVEDIGNFAFNGSQFSSITFEKDSQIQNIGAQAFENSNVSFDLGAMPDSLITVGTKLFMSCPNLYTSTGNIKLPKNIQTIGTYGFTNYLPWEIEGNVDFNDAPITRIPNYCFYDIQMHGDLVIPDYINFVGGLSFYRHRLTSITIPDVPGITLATLAFSGKINEETTLRKVIFLGKNPPSMNNAPFNFSMTPDFKMYVPDEYLDTYKSDSSYVPYLSFLRPMSEMED